MDEPALAERRAPGIGLAPLELHERDVVVDELERILVGVDAAGLARLNELSPQRGAQPIDVIGIRQGEGAAANARVGIALVGHLAALVRVPHGEARFLVEVELGRLPPVERPGALEAGTLAVAEQMTLARPGEVVVTAAERPLRLIRRLARRHAALAFGEILDLADEALDLLGAEQLPLVLHGLPLFNMS